MADEEKQDDTLAFLDNKPVEKPAETVVETPVEKPVVETPAPKVEDAVVLSDEEKSDDKTGQTVPLATYLDMRDKFKKATEKAPVETDPLAEEFVPPDPVKDPAGRAEYDRQVLSLNLMNERMNTSERLARIEHKDNPTLVDDAKKWALTRFDEDPHFAEKITSSADPYSEAIAAYQEHLEYQAFKASKKGATDGDGKTPAKETPETKPAVAAQPAAVTPKPVAKTPLPKSIADASSAGGTHTIPVGEGVAFDTMFPIN